MVGMWRLVITVVETATGLPMYYDNLKLRKREELCDIKG